MITEVTKLRNITEYFDSLVVFRPANEETFPLYGIDKYVKVPVQYEPSEDRLVVQPMDYKRGKEMWVRPKETVGAPF